MKMSTNVFLILHNEMVVMLPCNCSCLNNNRTVYRFVIQSEEGKKEGLHLSAVSSLKYSNELFQKWKSFCQWMAKPKVSRAHNSKSSLENLKGNHNTGRKFTSFLRDFMYEQQRMLRESSLLRSSGRPSKTIQLKSPDDIHNYSMISIFNLKKNPNGRSIMGSNESWNIGQIR